MPPATFPTDTTLRRVFEMELPSEYPVTVSPRFADGSMDFNLDADVRIRRWRIRYALLTVAQGATLDAHVESAKYSDRTGSAYSFDFTPRGGSLLTNVRYAPGGYSRPDHNKEHQQTRDVLLIQYP